MVNILLRAVHTFPMRKLKSLFGFSVDKIMLLKYMKIKVFFRHSVNIAYHPTILCLNLNIERNVFKKISFGSCNRENILEKQKARETCPTYRKAVTHK